MAKVALARVLVGGEAGRLFRELIPAFGQSVVSIFVDFQCRQYQFPKSFMIGRFQRRAALGGVDDGGVITVRQDRERDELEIVPMMPIGNFHPARTAREIDGSAARVHVGGGYAHRAVAAVLVHQFAGACRVRMSPGDYEWKHLAACLAIGGVRALVARQQIPSYQGPLIR